jgi:hypothetical protein
MPTGKGTCGKKAGRPPTKKKNKAVVKPTKKDKK